MFGWMKNITGRSEPPRLSDRALAGRFLALARSGALRARYDAAITTDDNRRHWANADALSADAAASADVRRTLRNRARYEVANNSYARGIVLTLANDTVGTGPRLQLLTGDDGINRQEQSIADQRAAVESYALHHGYEILDWYVDDAISGAGAAERDGFLRMIEDARDAACPFTAVLVYDVKRFGRLDNDETGYYRHILKQSGVDVVYVAEGFNGDDTDDLLRPVKQWQARQELKDLSKVTIRGLVSKADDGCWMGGVPPYGYDLAYYDEKGRFLMVVRYLARADKEILDDEGNVQRRLGKGDRPMISKSDRAHLVPSRRDRVETVRRIFGLYVQGGRGYKGIADRLNREGVPSARGGKWSMTSIRDMLSNPAYTGDMVWNRRSMAKFHRIEQGRAVPTPNIRRRAVEENGREDWMVTEDAHPPLIDRETFEQAQALRKKRGKAHPHVYRQGRGMHSDYLLTGLIVCANCGHNWQGYTQWKGRKRKDDTRPKTQYYACGGYVTKGNSVCRRSVIPRGAIEGQAFDAIGEHIRQYVSGGDGRARLRQALQGQLASEGQGGAVELERRRLEREGILGKIANILDNITPVNREFADRRIAELKGELTRIEPRLARLEATAQVLPDLDGLTDEVLAGTQRFDEIVAEGTVDEKRRFLRAFIHRIVIEPETRRTRLTLRDLPLAVA